jgi:hypothetical protein
MKHRPITHWLIPLPIIILVILAFNQFRLVHMENLSPWLGAGFGMFSTTDSVASRYLYLYGTTTAGMRRSLAVPDDLEEFAQRVRGLPDRQSMNRLAQQLHEYAAINDCPEEPKRCTYPEYRVEVWRTRYDPETLQPELEQIGGLDFKPE